MRVPRDHPNAPWTFGPRRRLSPPVPLYATTDASYGPIGPVCYLFAFVVKLYLNNKYGEICFRLKWQRRLMICCSKCCSLVIRTSEKHNFSCAYQTMLSTLRSFQQYVMTIAYIAPLVTHNWQNVLKFFMFLYYRCCQLMVSSWCSCYVQFEIFRLNRLYVLCICYSPTKLWDGAQMAIFCVIFAFCSCGLWLLSFFPRLISAVGDWMSTILPHIIWP